MFLGCDPEGIQTVKNKHLLEVGCVGIMKLGWKGKEGGREEAIKETTEVKSRVFPFLTCGHFPTKTCK